MNGLTQEQLLKVVTALKSHQVSAQRVRELENLCDIEELDHARAVNFVIRSTFTVIEQFNPTVFDELYQLDDCGV